MSDAVIRVIVGLIWKFSSAIQVAMIGDTASGYMVTPISSDTEASLKLGAAKNGVTFTEVN